MSDIYCECIECTSMHIKGGVEVNTTIDRLEAEKAELVEVLKIYASPDNWLKQWVTSPDSAMWRIDGNGFDLAKQTLEKYEK